MKPDTLGIIGLGALGGSVAWRAAQEGVKRVIGYSFMPKAGVAAAKVGAVTEITADIERVASLSELLVIDLSPLVTMEILEKVSEILVNRPGYCTDLASVKRPIVRKAAALRLERQFAGSHPLVELRTNEFAAARPDMLTGSLVYVTPVDAGEAAAAEVADFWKRVIGAEPVVLDAAAHDRTLAWTSHMPHVATAALAVSLAKGGPKGLTYAQSTIKATDSALDDADTWVEVLIENKKDILDALDSLLGVTGRLMADIEAEDARRIRSWFESGRLWREKMDR